MTCPVCKTNSCWLCGRKIGGGTYPTHYAWYNLSGCPAMQMADTWDNQRQLGNRASSASMCVYRLGYAAMMGCVTAVLAAMFCR